MPDLTLHGNSVPCPACEGRGMVPDPFLVRYRKSDIARVPMLDTNTCRNCRGLGRVPRPVEEIVAEMRQAAE